MNSEINDYNIINPDGIDKTKYNDGKKLCLNDGAGFIKESFTESQIESSRIKENESAKKESFAGNSSLGENSESAVAKSSSSQSSSLTISAVKATFAGSISAAVGTVAVTVATAAVVVAAFVSTLVINLSLIMATEFGLTFEVSMAGAQEEDFKTPIIAVLEGEDYVEEREIFFDTVYLEFSGLERDKEYTITVKNEERVFFKKSYYTASEENQRGFVEAWNEGEEVFVFVEAFDLKNGDLWTVTAKDEKGKIGRASCRERVYDHV